MGSAAANTALSEVRTLSNRVYRLEQQVKEILARLEEKKA